MLLQELREIAEFVLNFVDDIVALGKNAGLSMSPTMNLGKERAAAIQLSSIVLVVLITMYIKAFSAVPTTIDVAAFSLVCVAYFAIVSFLVSTVVRHFLVNVPEGTGKARDIRLDSTSYLLLFNTIALFIFALGRDLLYFTLGRNSLVEANVYAAIIGVVSATALVLLIRTRSSQQRSIFSVSQRLAIAGVMAVTFIIYAAIITVW